MRGAIDLQKEAEARIGRTIRGKWSLEHVIGVGGTAAVYAARHRNGSRVAVKVLHRRVALSPEQLARFLREGNTANRVGHRGVAVVYDDDVDEEGCPFLVMDLLQGQTLAARVAQRGRSLPPKEVLELTASVLDVLCAAHARGILHRDIKPQNLFLTDSGELKVLDFGIARLDDRALTHVTTEVGTLLGTPAFVPPEQARGRPDEMDPRSDLWAVGATMYTLLTGRHVHEAATPTEQLGLAMMRGAPSLGEALPSSPTPLVKLVDRALSYSREGRWQDARTMRDAVLWLLDRWETAATTPLEVPATWSVVDALAPITSNVLTGPAEDTTPLPRRHGRPRLGVALLTASLVGSCAVLWLSAREHPAPITVRPPSASPSIARPERIDVATTMAPLPRVTPFAAPSSSPVAPRSVRADASHPVSAVAKPREAKALVVSTAPIESAVPAQTAVSPTRAQADLLDRRN